MEKRFGELKEKGRKEPQVLTHGYPEPSKACRMDWAVGDSEDVC